VAGRAWRELERGRPGKGSWLLRGLPGGRERSRKEHREISAMRRDWVGPRDQVKSGGSL
jgi:hypothetical protein